MSRIDQLTGRGAQTVNSRSHSNIATKRRQELNLQPIRIGGLKLRVSARTLKTLKKLQRQKTGETLTLRAKKKMKRAEAQHTA